MKRPTVTQKAKPRPAGANPGLSKAKSPNDEDSSERVAAQPSQNKTTIDQWITRDDDYEGDPYAAEYNRKMEEARKGQRGGRRQKKKNQKSKQADFVDWDSIYDPAKPSPLDKYKGSEEQSEAVHEWKMRLHARRLKQRPLRESSDEETGLDPTAVQDKSIRKFQQFAPPATYDVESKSHQQVQDKEYRSNPGQVGSGDIGNPGEIPFVSFLNPTLQQKHKRTEFYLSSLLGRCEQNPFAREASCSVLYNRCESNTPSSHKIYAAMSSVIALV